VWLVPVLRAHDARLADRMTTPLYQALASRGPRSEPRIDLPWRVIRIAPGQAIQPIVDANPAGSTYRLEPGVHRTSTPIVLKAGDVMVGADDETVLNGARRLTTWTPDGPRWYTTGQTQGTGTDGHGGCQADYPRCNLVQDLFVDGEPLRHVPARDAVQPGMYYFDYAADRIYIGESPMGRTIETAITPYAFTGDAPDVTIANLTIQMFANPAQTGAIMGGAGWTIQDVTVTCCHGGGIEIRDGRRIVGCKVTYNGQIGVRGMGAHYLVDNTEIAYNNRCHYSAGWEAGGTKFASSRVFLLRENWVHHNIGPGLWLDIDNDEYSIVGNTVEDNYSTDQSCSSGIFLEISYSGIVRDNFVRRNGAGFSAWLWGAGILVAASGGRGLEIFDNVITDNAHGIALIQQSRGSGALGEYLVQNVHVHDNYIRTAGSQGAVQDAGSNAIFTSRHNWFDRNVYERVDAGFTWNNAFGSFAQWQAAGQDLHLGTIQESGEGGITPVRPKPEPEPITTTLTGTFTLTLTTEHGVPTKVALTASGEVA
jgi:Right handed beta helix region